MITYKLQTNGQYVARLNEDGSITSIPFDPFNVDAQEFASWLWSGEKPEPAEEGDEYVSDEWVDNMLKKFGYIDGVGG